MSNPRITYNGRNVDFTNGLADFSVLPMRSSIRTQAVSGAPSAINVNAGFSVVAILRNFKQTDATDIDLKTAVYELMSWLDYGGAAVLYMDRDYTVNTTLDGAVAAGASSIPVASATGVTSGRRYVIESSEHHAIVEASNSATDPVTTTLAVNFGFASGARFRDYEVLPFWGRARLIERVPTFWDLELSGIVDRRAL